MVELAQLQQLICIVENKTISKAADILHISQPALTRSLKKMEEELGVELFDHQKNKIILNDYGKLAYEHAIKINESVQIMQKDIFKLSKSLTSCMIGSIAPAPMWALEKQLHSIYENIDVHTSIENENELIKGLLNKDYHAIILSHPINDKNILSYHYIDEQLFLSVPFTHRLSKENIVSFEDLKNETMLLYSHIGFWHDMHMKTMPKTKFLMQDKRDTFNQLVGASTFPSFTSNLSISREGKTQGRKIIPFKNKEAFASFYIVILKENKEKLNKLIENLEDLI